MATDAQVTSLRLRKPNLSAIITNDVAKQYLDDAIVETPAFGLKSTDAVYDKAISTYALHLMVVAGLVQDVSAESVKDVSRTYQVAPLNPGETRYYQEFRKMLRRNKPPGFILVAT